MSDKTKNQCRILIVDDHPIVRDGLSLLIQQEHDLVVCGQASDPESAMEIARKEHPDLAIVDLMLGKTSGIELIKSLGIEFPGIKLLVLSMHEEIHYAERSLRAGAHGYVTKREVSDSIVTAIQRVRQGRVYVNDQMSSILLQRMIGGKTVPESDSVEFLSDRELEVFELIGKGVSTSKIAEQLHLSVKTIETYRANIKTKLDLPDTRALTLRAYEWVSRKSEES
jgi:DNA-binding NarL/FixJ family response regulator